MERKRTITELKSLFSGLTGKSITDHMMRELITALYPSDANLTSIAAEKVIPDTANFAGLFDEDDDNLQKILEILDDHNHDSRYYTETEINNTLANYETITGAANKYQPKGNELTALQALADTAGFLKKTGDGAYSIDPTSYATAAQMNASGLQTDYIPYWDGNKLVSSILKKYGGALIVGDYAYAVYNAVANGGANSNYAIISGYNSSTETNAVSSIGLKVFNGSGGVELLQASTNGVAWDNGSYGAYLRTLQAGAQLHLGISGSNTPLISLLSDSTIKLSPLAGTGNRLVTASSTGVLGSSTALNFIGNDYIKNQYDSAQTANMWISGSGRFDTNLIGNIVYASNGLNVQGVNYPLINFIKSNQTQHATIYSADYSLNLRVYDSGGNYATPLELTKGTASIVGTTGDVFSVTNSIGKYALNAYTWSTPSSHVLSIGSGGYYNVTNGTTNTYLNTTGFGINNTDPQHALDVTGNIGIKGVGQRLFFDTLGARNTNYIYIKDNYDLSFCNGRGYGSEFVLGNEYVYLKTNSTTRLIFNNATGTATFNDSFRIISDSPDGVTTHSSIRANPTTGNLVISPKSAAIYFSYDHGAGAHYFCNGTPTIVTMLDSSGVTTTGYVLTSGDNKPLATKNTAGYRWNIMTGWSGWYDTTLLFQNASDGKGMKLHPTGVLVLDAAQGLAPLTVASTTMVINLNAEKVGGYSESQLAGSIQNYASVTDFHNIGGKTQTFFASEYGAANCPPGFYGEGIRWALVNSVTTYQRILASAYDRELYWKTQNEGNWSGWSKIYHSGNLTNTLSTNYIPYWNGTNLVSSHIKFANNNYGIHKTPQYYSFEVNGDIWASGSVRAGANIAVEFSAIGYNAFVAGHNGISFSTNHLNVGVENGRKMHLTGNGELVIGGTTAYFKLDVNGTIGLNGNKIHFRTNDFNHAIGYDGTTNGPFMYGYAGTALGYMSGGTPTITLYTYNDKVFIPSITFSTNRLIVMTPANGFSTIADGTPGYFLKTDGSGGYTWAAAGGFTDPMSTRGDIMYRNSSNVTARLGIGTADSVLRSNGTDVSWGVDLFYVHGGYLRNKYTLSGESFFIEGSRTNYCIAFFRNTANNAFAEGVYIDTTSAYASNYSDHFGIKLTYDGNTTTYFGVETGGNVVMKSITAPSTTPASGKGWLFIDSSDSKLKFKNSGGTLYDLTATGVSSQWTNGTYGIYTSSVVGIGSTGDASWIQLSLGNQTTNQVYTLSSQNSVSTGIAGFFANTNTGTSSSRAIYATSSGTGANMVVDINNASQNSSAIGISVTAHSGYAIYTTQQYGVGTYSAILSDGTSNWGGMFVATAGSWGIGVSGRGSRQDFVADYSGIISMKDITSPSNPGTGYSNIYSNSGVLYIRNSGGTSTVVGTQTSDFWLKKDFRKLETPLEKILQVNGYSFNYQKEPAAFAPKDAISIMLTNDTGKRDASGVIAQEIEKLIPESVYTSDNGYKSVNYNHVVPYLIEAMKELNNKIETLESKLSKYE
jgi:hypothetical protein